MGAMISDLVADTNSSRTLSNDILTGNVSLTSTWADWCLSAVKTLRGASDSHCVEEHGFLQRMKSVLWNCKPVVIYGNLKGSPPIVLDTSKVLHNLGVGGKTFQVTVLLICDLQYAGVHFHAAYASTEAQCPKLYFYKNGNLAQMLSFLPEVDRCLKFHNNSTSSHRKLLLSNLAHLLNYTTGSLWLNGLCISGPEEVDDRLKVLEVATETTPPMILLQVEDLIGIQCVRTSTRLELYGQCRYSGRTKSIWFRGDFVSCLLVSEVSNCEISVLLPSFQYVKEHLLG